MTIKVGDRVPESTLMEMGESGPQPITSADLFGGKTVGVFALPGAFTPNCSAKHMPGYIQNAEALKAKGVDDIACVSVNDVFVMAAWGKAQEASGKIRMLADGNGDFTTALGLAFDASGFGMGQRSERYSMIVKDGVVAELNVEEKGAFDVSSAEHMLGQL